MMTFQTYPFEHFKKQMPKEIQDLITPESLTHVNEFETLEQAVLAGVIWTNTKDAGKLSQYYDTLA